MEQFIDQILTSILKSEGGLVNDPNDPGGITNYGVTVKSLSEYRQHTATPDDIRNLTGSDARALYYEMYIVKPGFDQLDARLVPIVVDTGVLNGRERATKWLQEILGATADGKLGTRTLEALNGREVRPIIVGMVQKRLLCYADLAAANSKLVKFLPGWTKRAVAFLQ